MMTAADLRPASRVLVDTNVLLRIQSTKVRELNRAGLAVERLRSRQAVLLMTFQNVSEFWNSSTRPKTSNGLGLSIIDSAAQLQRFEQGISLLVDTLEVYERWRTLLQMHLVIEKQVHDARLAASMLVHNVPYILTFNTRDFARYAGVTAIDPEELV